MAVSCVYLDDGAHRWAQRYRQVAKIALNKLDVDPNLFTLMVSIARKDINASVKAFRKVSVAILGRRDELLSDLCESIIQILMKKEGSEMSEVILKKIVTKLLLYTKPKMLSEIEARVKNNKDEVKISPEEIKEGMSHINTDLIFALNSLSFKQSSDVLLELLALIFRIADEKLYSTLRIDGIKYNPMFGQNRKHLCGILLAWQNPRPYNALFPVFWSRCRLLIKKLYCLH